MLSTAPPLAAAAVLVLATATAAHPLTPEGAPPSVGMSVRVGVSVSAALPSAADTAAPDTTTADTAAPDTTTADITADNQFWITQVTEKGDFASLPSAGQQWCCLGAIRVKAMGLNTSSADADDVMSSNPGPAVEKFACLWNYYVCAYNFDQDKWVEQGRNLNVVLTLNKTTSMYEVTVHEAPYLPPLPLQDHPFAVVQLAQPPQE